MKSILILFSLINLTYLLSAQNPTEYEIHKRSIDSTWRPQLMLDNPDSVFNRTTAFVDYTIRNLLIKSEDKYFIANRKLLRKLQLSYCDSSEVHIKDTMAGGAICEIRVHLGLFDSSKHTIINHAEYIETIDGAYPYGAEYEVPVTEINLLQVFVNGVPLHIPAEAYSNLYEPNFCDTGYSAKPVEAYTSIDGKYIYIYIYGGISASSYFGKLIFDMEKYLTRIVADYFPLTICGSFSEDFVGF